MSSSGTSLRVGIIGCGVVGASVGWHLARSGAGVLDTRIGRRPIPGDELPSVGGVEMLPGYYEAVMHSGVTLAAFVGRLLTETILDGIRDERLSRYRPDRFQ